MRFEIAETLTMPAATEPFWSALMVSALTRTDPFAVFEKRVVMSDALLLAVTVRFEMLLMYAALALTAAS